jgi:hypothetical protein
MSYWSQKAHRKYMHRKAEREEAWESFWAGLLCFILCPIATIKFMRSKVREELQ